MTNVLPGSLELLEDFEPGKRDQLVDHVSGVIVVRKMGQVCHAPSGCSNLPR